MLMGNNPNSDWKVLIMRGTTKQGFKRETRFWAERGLIHCEDNINGYSSMSVRTFLKRVDALNEMLGNSDPHRDRGADYALRAETIRNVETATLIASQAQVQGMPQDASARRDMVRRRKRTVCVGGGSNSIL